MAKTSQYEYQANYYQWFDNNADKADRLNRFVYLDVSDQGTRLRLCGTDAGTTSIYGVTIDRAGFIGGYLDGMNEDNKYQYDLVAHTGVVPVRCESDVVVGDYVISNKDGMAQKSTGKFGFYVVSLAQTIGRSSEETVYYANVKLGVSLQQDYEVYKDIIDINEDIDEINYRIDETNYRIDETSSVLDNTVERVSELETETDDLHAWKSNPTLDIKNTTGNTLLSISRTGTTNSVNIGGAYVNADSLIYKTSNPNATFIEYNTRIGVDGVFVGSTPATSATGRVQLEASTGKLYANKAEITGTINSGSTISSFNVGDDSLYIGTNQFPVTKRGVYDPLYSDDSGVYIGRHAMAYHYETMYDANINSETLAINRQGMYIARNGKYGGSRCIDINPGRIEFFCTTSCYDFNKEVGEHSSGFILAQDGYVYLAGTWLANECLGSASDMNVKHDIESLDQRYDTLFDGLVARSFKYNHGTSGRTHTGFIFQEARDATLAAGLTEKDFAALITMKKTDENNNETETSGLRYEEFIALNTDQIQKLKKRVVELEEKIADLSKE